MVYRGMSHTAEQTHTDQLLARTQPPLVILEIMGLGQDLGVSVVGFVFNYASYRPHFETKIWNKLDC